MTRIRGTSDGRLTLRCALTQESPASLVEIPRPVPRKHPGQVGLLLRVGEPSVSINPTQTPQWTEA